MRVSRERRLNSTLDNYQQVPGRIAQTIIDQKGNPQMNNYLNEQLIQVPTLQGLPRD